MEINEIGQDGYLDIFSTPAADAAAAAAEPFKANFGAEVKEVNIFDKPADEGAGAAPGAATPGDEGTGDNKKPEDEVELGPDGQPKPKEVDILDTGKATPGRKPKYAFEDAVGYFEDRIKNGKFVRITTENEKGEDVDFLPKTPEEFDEVIEIQVNHKLEQERKTLEKSWVQSKSPAWQAVAKYADMVDNPADVIPFLQGVKNIESVAAVNEDEIDGAEKIVRTRLAQKGDSDDIIDEQIELLKTTDKLISTAKKYKPMIINEEKAYLGQLKREREAEEVEYNNLVNGIRTKAIEAIETPIFGKQKLKNEEKAAIYDLIGEPDAQSRGYKIYSYIDSLFEKGDFETLRKVAFLAANPTAFVNYLTIDAKNQAASSLQQKLKVATEVKSGGNMDTDDEPVRVQRTQYKAAPRFGR